jgi:hypothetical protein
VYDKIPIDWSKVCLNIRRHISLAEAQRRVGCEPQLLNRLAREETYEPRFTVAVKLLDLHLDLCGLAEHKNIYY